MTNIRVRPQNSITRFAIQKIAFVMCLTITINLSNPTIVQASSNPFIESTTSVSFLHKNTNMWFCITTNGDVVVTDDIDANASLMTASCGWGSAADMIVCLSSVMVFFSSVALITVAPEPITKTLAIRAAIWAGANAVGVCASAVARAEECERQAMGEYGMEQEVERLRQQIGVMRGELWRTEQKLDELRRMLLDLENNNGPEEEHVPH